MLENRHESGVAGLVGWNLAVFRGGQRKDLHDHLVHCDGKGERR